MPGLKKYCSFDVCVKLREERVLFFPLPADEKRASFVGDLLKQANKKIVSTVPWQESILENAWKALEGTFSMIRIFGATASEILKDIDLSGKTCLITGGGSGIGLEMARCLNSRNCNILLPCRNTYAVNRIVKSVFDHQNTVRLYDMNLASLASVKSCSEEIINNHKNIDIVILNAGVFGIPWILTEDGIEMTFQVNYLSQYYLLTTLDKILSPNVRVVVTASESHRYVNWSWNTALMPTEEQVSLPADEYTSIRAYNISKLCSILMMRYLGNRWLNSNRSIFAVHPGSFVKTRLCQNWWVYEALYTAMIPFTKSIAQAASTPIYCAVSPDLNNQTAYYFKNCERTEVSALASDRHLAYRINDVTNDILRERIPDLQQSKTYTQSIAKVEKVDMRPKDDELMANYSG